MLGSYAEGLEGIFSLEMSSWASINQMGNFLITHCLRESTAPGGGVVVIPTGKHRNAGGSRQMF